MMKKAKTEKQQPKKRPKTPFHFQVHISSAEFLILILRAPFLSMLISTFASLSRATLGAYLRKLASNVSTLSIININVQAFLTYLYIVCERRNEKEFEYRGRMLDKLPLYSSPFCFFSFICEGSERAISKLSKESFGIAWMCQ